MRPTKDQLDAIRNCRGCEDYHAEDLLAEIDALTSKLDIAILALETIADIDYEGTRTPDYIVAQKCLKEISEGK